MWPTYVLLQQDVRMKRRTTIEIDDELLARAKRALGATTTRATVEQALMQAAADTEGGRADRAARQRQYLHRPNTHADVAVLATEDMWR